MLRLFLPVALASVLTGCLAPTKSATPEPPPPEAERHAALPPPVLAVPPDAEVCRYPDGTPVPEAGPVGTPDWRARLSGVYGSLQVGDRAVSEAAMARRNAMVLALRCSPNDVFWSHLALAGLAEAAPTAKGAAPISRGVRRYRLTERGQEKVPALLRDLERNAR